MPPYGFHPPPVGGRYVGRGGSRRHSERDRERDETKRHDFHPWDHTTEPVPKRKWNDDREQRPKILMKDKDWREGDKAHLPDEKKASESIVTDTIPISASAKVSDDVDTDNQSPPLVPAMRSQQPKKIMLRKMSDNSKELNEKEKAEGGKTSDHTNDVKSSNAGKTSTEQDSTEVVTGSSTVKHLQMAWKVTSAKTLYEPEGKKSEAKFRKYQHDARGGSGHKEKSGHSPATTPSDTQPPVHIPDVIGRDKLPLKRTYSGDRGREGGDRGVGRRGRTSERFDDEDRHKWNEQRKNQRDHPGPQRDAGRKDQHSGSDRDYHIREQSKQHSKHSERQQQQQQQKPREQPKPHSEVSSQSIEQSTQQVEHFENKGGRHISGRTAYDGGHSQGRREGGRRARSDRKSRGSETDDQKEETNREPHSVKSRVTNETDSKSISRDTSEDKIGNKESSSQHRKYHGSMDQGQNRSDRRPNRTQRLPSKQDDLKQKDDHKGPVKPSLEKKDLPSTAIPEATMAPKTTTVTAVTNTTVAIVPASVPQTVINKSVSVQTSDHLPLELPLSYPPTINRPRPPLLQDPPQTLRKEYVELRTNKRPRTMPDHHQKKQDRRRGPDVSRGEGANRGGRRGSQRGRGRDNDSLSKQTSTQLSAEVEGKGGSDRGRGKRRDRIHAIDHPEDHGKPLLQEEHSVEQSKRNDSGRGRDRRRQDRDRGSRKNDPPVGPAAKKGNRPEHRVGGAKEWSKGPGNKSNFTPVENKLSIGYGDFLEDIESDSDWDEHVESPGKKTEGDTVSESNTHSRSYGKGQRIDIDRVESNRNDIKRSIGGRGRVRGGRQGGRPGSFKRASGRPQESNETTHKPVSPVETSCHDDLTENPTVVHKQQEFAKYDLNSTTIAIVDDIGGPLQPEEIESMVEFVEVTSKKTQKEKVKKEREEKWRLSSGSVESRDEQKKSRKPATVRSTEPSLSLKPSTAWSSKGEESSGTNIWSTSTTAPSSDWGSLGPMTSSTAPGAQLKDPPWPAMNVSAAVGVIGEGLQARPVSNTLANQTEPLSSTVEYSLFPEHALSLLPPTPYVRGGGMLNAAVTMKISQEHLTSTESPGLGSQITKTDLKEEKLTAVKIKETEPIQSSVKPDLPVQQKRSHDNQARTRALTDEEHSSLVSGDHAKRSLPPRLQSNRSSNPSGSVCVGRGRGSTRGRRGERSKRGGGGEGERRGHDVPGESNRENSQHRHQRTKDKV